MERNLASGLASRLVIFGLVALLIYGAMPDSICNAGRLRSYLPRTFAKIMALTKATGQNERIDPATV